MRPPALSVDSEGGGMLLGDDPRWGDSAMDSVNEDPFNGVVNNKKRRRINAAHRKQAPNPSGTPAHNVEETGVK